MRDRSRARNYSASRAEFRRAHERHRAWGLQRRHSERLRQVREREAGCWPADLQVVGIDVEDGRSGLADELSPDTGRLLVRRGTRGRACDPPDGSDEPTGSARQAGPAGKPPPRAAEHPAAKPCLTPTNHDPHPAPARSHEQAPGRDHASADERADVTPPHPPARPPRPRRAGEHKNRPPRPAVTRHARKSIADDQQFHDQNTRQKAFLTPAKFHRSRCSRLWAPPPSWTRLRGQRRAHHSRRVMGTGGQRALPAVVQDGNRVLLCH